MPSLSKPTFPVVDVDPSWRKCLGNFNIGDIAAVGGFAGMGYGFGFFGSSIKLRGPMARFNMGIGLIAGTMYGIMSSSQRLQGLEENTHEVHKWGIMSNAEIEIAKDRMSRPNIELINDGTRPRK